MSQSPLGAQMVNLCRQLFSLFTGRYKHWLNFIFAALTVFVIGQTIYRNRQVLLELQWRLQPSWLALALLLFLINMLLSPLVWHLFVKRLTGFDDRRQSVKIWLTSNLSKRLPGAFWYIASRAALYAERGVAMRQISLISGLEMILSVISGLLVTLCTLPFWVVSPTTLLGNRWLLPLFLLVGVFVVHPNSVNLLWARLNRDTPPPELAWRDTLQWHIYYIGIWLISGSAIFALVNLLQPLEMKIWPTLIGFWALANSLSFAGSFMLVGIGAREISLLLLLTQLLPFPIALAVTLLARILFLAAELLCALFAHWL